MKVHKAFKYRIYPTVRQQKQLGHHFGCSRFIYNYFLNRKTQQYKASKKSDTFVQMCRHLTELKKQPGHGWLSQVSRQCLANTLANLDEAFNNFYNRKGKYPKFKNRYDKHSFKICPPFCYIKSEGIHLPQIGVISLETDLPTEYKLCSITISRTVTRKYYASINVEIEIPDPKINSSKPEIGIDFGLKHFITTSDGNKVDHPKPFRFHQRKLRRFQRSFSRRRNKQSNRRKFMRRKIALLHERISNARADFLHKLSRKLVGENQAIYLEDLNIKGMMNRYGKGCGDAGWYEFTRQLEYKGKWYGCGIVKIDRFYPSSKTCSKCGDINNGLELKDREWICLKCSAHHDRDWNAAKNVLVYGRADRNLRTGRVVVVNTLEELSSHE